MSDTTTEIKAGQHWQNVETRYETPVVEIVSVGTAYRRQIRSVGSEPQFRMTRDITMRRIDTGRTTVARDDRFNGKRGGYKLVKETP